MYNILVIMAVFAAILLALIVLVQESKGGGLASNYATGNQMMGVRKTSDFIEKATWTLAGLLVVFCVTTTFVAAPEEVSAADVITNMKTTPATPALPGQQQTQDAAPATPAK